MADFKMGDNRPKQKFHAKKKKPTVLVFDESARKEYLTGFKKRKQEKRKRKSEEFDKLLREEKKRIKAEAKETLKSLLPKRKSLPQLDDLMNEEIDYGTHTVKIAELSSEQIAQDNSFIGENRATYESDEESEDKESVHSNENFVEGMDTYVKGKRKKRKPGDERNAADFRTARDIRRAVMHQVTQKMQNSKIIQKKEQIDKIISRKRAKREQKRREIRERKRGGKKKKGKK